MHGPKIFACLLILCGTGARAQDGRLIQNPIRNIPKWVRDDYYSKNLNREYAVGYKLYPYTFRGDFNGDGRRDVVIQIVEKRSGKAGLAIFHGRKPQAMFTHVAILGAGKPLGGAGDDFKWVGIWNRVLQSKIPSGGYRGLSDIHGDILVLQKHGSKTGLVYWDGKQYQWHRLKD